MDTTINQAIDKYLMVVGGARSINTHKTYKNALEAFKLSLAAHNVDSSTARVDMLKESVLATFLDYLKDYTPATERLYVQAAMGLYKFLMAEEYASFNTAKMDQIVGMRIRGVGRRIPQFPIVEIEKVVTYIEEMRTIENNIDQLIYLRDRAFILVLADTGLRVHEACNLRRGDIDWHEGRAVIIGKGDKQAVIRFTTRALNAMKDYLKARAQIDGASGRQLSSLPIFSRHDKGAGGKIIQIDTATGRGIVHERVNQALGHDAQITPHSFRHYFVTKILQRSNNIKMAQELARHSNISTTGRYAHLTDDELDKGYLDVFEGK